MKLAQGEYVALEKVENLISSSPLIAQIFVYGDSLQSYLVGIVVPDPVQLAALTSKIEGKTISPVDEVALAEAVKNPKINKAILEILTKDGVEHGLRGYVRSYFRLRTRPDSADHARFEMVKRIHLSMNPFSVENNTLTPTMKLRRYIIRVVVWFPR
jgi:long-chain acyl-CoA synthetase